MTTATCRETVITTNLSILIIYAETVVNNWLLVSIGYHYYLNDIARNHLCDFPRPHLVIYLDADVAQTKENLKQRNHVSNRCMAIYLSVCLSRYDLSLTSQIMGKVVRIAKESLMSY